MQKIIISNKNSKQRIDKFLAKEFFSYTRGEIIRQIKEGNILVNNKRIKPSYVLREEDIILMEHKTWGMEQKNIISNSKIKLNIVYKGKNIIIVNKPAGIQVHPDNNEKNNTLANALIAKFPEIKNVGEDSMRPGIVHRLDKDTSGVMIIARNQEAFKELKNQFKNRKVEKKYWAIVLGKLKNKSGNIEKPIARASNYRKQVIAGKKTKTKIRKAVTEYKVIKEFNNYSLVEISPKTGRMHQIRVHMNSINHPVLGDRLYGFKKTKRELAADRQMLHAKSLNLDLFKKKYFFETELPDDFMSFLNRVD